MECNLEVVGQKISADVIRERDYQLDAYEEERVSAMESLVLLQRRIREFMVARREINLKAK